MGCIIIIYIRTLRIYAKRLRKQVIYLAVCTFAGHREVFSSSIEADIDCALEEIIQTDDDFIFYSGGMGEFDKMCSSAVRSIKRCHPKLDISLVAVLPYMMNSVNTNRDYYETYFDDILIPAELADVHYKAAISRRNQWLVDHSDYLISYVYRDFGGAYTTLNYAARHGKEIINLANHCK